MSRTRCRARIPEQLAGGALDGDQVGEAVTVEVADADQVAHAVPAGANSHPGAQAGDCARIEPEVAGGSVAGDQVDVTVAVEVTDSRELAHRVPAGPIQRTARKDVPRPG